jgi:hypothetical protein
VNRRQAFNVARIARRFKRSNGLVRACQLDATDHARKQHREHGSPGTFTTAHDSTASSTAAQMHDAPR